MASTGLQLVGFILGVLSWIGMIATCASPEWRKNSQGKTILDKTMRYEGLWTQCEAYPTGETHCSVYIQFFVELPSILQVCRALMIASITLGFIATIITILGIKCTSIGNSNPRAKARASIIGGFLFLAAAVLVGASVSYYAHGVVQEYYNPVADTPMHMRMEYGSALFVGWAALVVGILGALILIFTSIYVLVRLNVAERRRGGGIPGMRVKENRPHQTNQPRQQHLPMTQHHRNAHARMHAGARPQESSGALTKHRIAQHNAKVGPKNGHSHHHAQPNVEVPVKHGHRPTSVGETSKSSSERRRWSDENHPEKQIADQPDGSRSRQQQHHHHMHTSKSEGHIRPRSKDEGERDDRSRPRHENDQGNGDYTRRRPAKEYV